MRRLLSWLKNFNDVQGALTRTSSPGN